MAQPASPERDAALAAALKQWESVSSKTAEEELLALHPVDRVSIVAITLAAAAGRTSDEAVREAIRFCDEDPPYALDYGRALISALAKTGDYPAALDFVLAEDADGGLGENGHKWLGTLFTAWAGAAPAQAAAAAQKSVGAGQRGEALQIVAAAWAKTDPTAAANFAWQLPPSTERNLMLNVALHHWSDADPTGAAAWLEDKKQPGP